MLRVKVRAWRRRPGNVCLRGNRRPSQAVAGGGGRRGREGAAEPERGERPGADLTADRRAAGRDTGGVRAGLRLGLAGRAAGGLRVRPAPGAPAAVQGDRLGAAEERQGRRGDPGAAAAGGPAARGVDRATAGPPAAGAAAPGQPGPARYSAARPDPCGRRGLRLRPARQLLDRAGPGMAGRARPAAGVTAGRHRLLSVHRRPRAGDRAARRRGAPARQGRPARQDPHGAAGRRRVHRPGHARRDRRHHPVRKCPQAGQLGRPHFHSPRLGPHCPARAHLQDGMCERNGSAAAMGGVSWRWPEDWICTGVS
jgi:hypothetical protein